MAPIADKKLWDSLGNFCRVELYCTGRSAFDDAFEVYFHDFNHAVPRRFVGGLGELNARVELWLSIRKAEGWQEQLPSYEPMPKA